MTAPGAPLPGSGSICLTFDFDTMAAWMGGFSTATPGVLSRGEFGGRVGIYRVLDVLGRYQLPATFFIPGYPGLRFARMTEVAEEFRARAGGPAT